MAFLAKHDKTLYPHQVSAFRWQGIATGSHIDAQQIHEAGRPGRNRNSYIVHDVRRPNVFEEEQNTEAYKTAIEWPFFIRNILMFPGTEL